jgi:curved DNA-binding protein CbpA
MRTQPNHYAVLGLQSGASADAIKRRFRELARKYHPDVSTEPDAAMRFRAINEAYQVLGDHLRRADYDAFVNRTTTSPSQPSSSRTEARATGKPHQSQPRPEANRKQEPTSSQKVEMAQELMKEAHNAAKWRRMKEAELFCREALKLDRKCSPAYDLLGDLYQSRGRSEEAIAMYSYALQLDAKNAAIQRKFDRLTGAATTAKRQPQSPKRPAQTAGSSRTREARPITVTRKVKRSPSTLPAASIKPLVNALGSIAFVALVALAGRNPVASAAPTFIPLEWNLEIVLGLALAGAAMGILLRVNDLVGSLASDMRGGSSSQSGPPAGAIVAGFSIVSIFVAGAVYIIAMSARGNGSRSIERAMGAAVGVAMIFALIRPESFFQLAASGGSITFIALIGGWALAEKIHGD